MSNVNRVIIVGAGFAGFRCAKKLVENKDLHVTLIDKRNFHQFTPLLYQVATCALSPEDVATPLRNAFEGYSNIDIKMDEVIAVDPQTKSIKTKAGLSYTGDYLVLAAGSVVNFFGTSGADIFSFPLYSLQDAEKLRSRILAVFEEADTQPSLIDKGALNFVIVGAGPTGTELAGALADMVDTVLPRQFSDLRVQAAKIYLVDYSHAVLGHFSAQSQEYAHKILTQRGVEIRLGVGVKEVASDHVELTDGSKILTRTVVWAGGLKAQDLASFSQLPQGHGGRIDVGADFSISEFPGVYAIGDFACVANQNYPQLASIAQQSGLWLAKNILHEIAKKPTVDFVYDDKGIMAMIGRNAAVAELGKKRHQLEGVVAFAAWLGVHAALMSSVRQRINAFMEWAWEYFGKRAESEILDQESAAHIDWES